MGKSVLLLLFFCAIALFSCQKSQPAPEKPALPWAGKMTLNTEPAQPQERQQTTFRVTLADESGQTVPGAEVKISLKMPSMDMGKNEARLGDLGNGVYEGKARFTMAGPWNVIVTATKDGKTGAQTFPIVARKAG